MGNLQIEKEIFSAGRSINLKDLFIIKIHMSINIKTNQ